MTTYQNNQLTLTPEQKARKIIDSLFSNSGWEVVDRDSYSPTTSAAAIEEGLLNHNLEADYLLFINGTAIGVLEAKKESYDIVSDAVKAQAENYVANVPNTYKKYSNVLPLIFISNGKRILFRDFRDPDSEYQEISQIPTPREICKILKIDDIYAGLPALKKQGLRDCQYEAITELEKSFRTGQDRALLVLATGAGKTYTACTACYRFLAYTPMRRILFLVDRNNLGKQASDEFGKYKLTETGDPFNTIYGVEKLTKPEIPDDANVVISTIQRLFALLSGTPITDSDDDEDNQDDDGTEVGLPENPKLPKNYFDVIIIDECHRSIYGKWKQVLEYFNTAKLIGLTATPGPETMAFFNNNRVVNYTLEKSIVDGVNVGSVTYRIRTRETEDGGAIREGSKVTKITRYTGEVEDIRQTQTQTYTAAELNRSIVNPAQIKLILETYRDAIYTEMFVDPPREPNMDYIPKTLIFALSEAHANNIVKIAKEVFSRTDNKFVQKITCTAGNSNQLIREFRTSKEFRIAVTVTLVATGTDVKPLEVVMFMRDVQSEQLYIQMKGRGCRTIGDAALRAVTPNATSKDQYILVDAVGVTEHAKSIEGPSIDPPQPTITLKELLEKISHGNLQDDYLQTLASRLSRIHNKSKDEDRTKFVTLSGGFGMDEIASNIFNTFENGTLPSFLSINDANNERKGLVAPIANHPAAKKWLLKLNAGFVEILHPGEDELIDKGFVEESGETVTAFEQYIEAHKDDIEALRMIYNNTGEPISYSMLLDLQNQLREANRKFSIFKLWNCYTSLAPEKVDKNTTREQREALTTLIQLIRFAYKQIKKLTTLHGSAAQYFNLWCGQAQRPLTDKQKEIIQSIVNYVICNGCCEISDIRQQNKTQAAQLINEFGGKENANAAIISLSQFLIYHKVA